MDVSKCVCKIAFLKTHIQLKFGLDNSALTTVERLPSCDLGLSLMKVPLLVDLTR
jgi:hypothetical protein